MGLIPEVIAVPRDMARLVADVAGFGPVGAVAAEVASFVTVVANRARVSAAALGAVACNVASFIAVVAGRLVGALRALAGYVTRAITSGSYTFRYTLNIHIGK